MDWDNDGDLDLILGDYYDGQVFFTINEGSASKPKFSGKNKPVMAGGKPIVIKDGLAAPRVVDWNGDGLFDILCGGAKGGVFAYINVGTRSEPKFKSSLTLIAPIEDKSKSYIKLVPAKDGKPSAPGSSYHIEVVDYDGDGDLDLLVGGRSSWRKADAKKLTAEEKEELQKLNDEQSKLMTVYSELFKNIKKPEDQKKIMESKEFKDISKKLTDVMRKKQKFDTNPNDSGDFVWLYRRK